MASAIVISNELPNVSQKSQLVCTVCGDAAIGRNFGAVVCESCKSFYRRHAGRCTNFHCPAHGACQLSKSDRKQCAACRLKKCFAVGMRVPAQRCGFEIGAKDKLSCFNEKQERRKLLVTRLVQRLTERNSESLAQVSLSDAHYHDLATRISCAEAELRRPVDRVAVTSDCQLGEESGKTCVRLALHSYVRALKCFPELLRLDDWVQRSIFREHMVAQLLMYTMFHVTDDLSGWRTVDSQGTPSDERFSEFVRCLSQDGIDARFFVQQFCDLCASLRSRFVSDWPSVLLTLCLIDLFSSCTATSQVSRLQQQHLRYHNYLKCYLQRRYGVHSAAFYDFCTQQFPGALRKLVDLQTSMLQRAEVSKGVSTFSVLEPVISEIVNLLSCP